LGQLKSTLYARMEEVSFRAGAVAAGGVLTAAGVAITLAVVLGGHSDAVASASASRAAVPSAVPPVLAPVSSSPPATPPSATPRASRTTSPATVAGAYPPPSATRASATRASAARQAAATSALGRTPTPRLREARSLRRPGMPPGYWRSHRQRPWLYGLLWHRRR
jgi:hypothetical protein